MNPERFFSTKARWLCQEELHLGCNLGSKGTGHPAATERFLREDMTRDQGASTPTAVAPELKYAQVRDQDLKHH